MILGVVERADGAPTETSLEMLTMARDLAADAGTSLGAVVFGTGAEAVADDLGTHGVEEIRGVDDPRLDTYAPEARTAALEQLVDEVDPAAVVAPGTDRGHEVLARLGAARDLPMAANCVDVAPDADGYELSRHRWGGSLVEHARLDAETALLTAAEHEFPVEAAADPADPAVHSFAPSLAESDFRVQVDRVEKSDVEGVPLGQARVVVGGGRGVGGADGYAQLEDLADLLGGTVGASRAAVNEGWRPHDDQIGLTGTKISPDLYIACGISGAVQHMVGCKGAENILVINTDPEAAIMGKADYAVVGDLHEVVPELVAALRERDGG